MTSQHSITASKLSNRLILISVVVVVDNSRIVSENQRGRARRVSARIIRHDGNKRISNCYPRLIRRRWLGQIKIARANSRVPSRTHVGAVHIPYNFLFVVCRQLRGEGGRGGSETGAGRERRVCTLNSAIRAHAANGHRRHASGRASVRAGSRYAADCTRREMHPAAASYQDNLCRVR